MYIGRDLDRKAHAVRIIPSKVSGVGLLSLTLLLAIGCKPLESVSPAGPRPSGISIFAGRIPRGGHTDGPGATARFNNPVGVALDPQGNLFVADANNNTIRKVAPDGRVSTVAGTPGTKGSADGTAANATFDGPSGVAVDARGALYVTDYNTHIIRKISPEGGVSTLAGMAGTSGHADGQGTAASFSAPFGIAVDGTGTIFVGDSNNTIREITPSGRVTTLAGTAGAHGSLDGIGQAARFDGPGQLSVDAAGNLVLADTNNCTIRLINPGSGTVTTLAGVAGQIGSADGPCARATFNYPSSVARDRAGNVYVGDGNNTLRKITPSGAVSTLAGRTGVPGCADGLGSAATFNGFGWVGVDPLGNLILSDGSYTIGKVSPGGLVSTVAGSA